MVIMSNRTQQKAKTTAGKSSPPRARMKSTDDYVDNILRVSDGNLKRYFSPTERDELLKRIKCLRGSGLQTREKIDRFCNIYADYCKEIRRAEYPKADAGFCKKINAATPDNVHIIWRDCVESMAKMESESIQLMVTSPPYYNARQYSQWENLDTYLADMSRVIAESYRVLENHRAFVFNVGDITGNDNRYTRSVWGARRIPLGAYFINIFEKNGFTFVDDFIWDKGQVESQRHKNGDTPFPMYQYPMNAYEHIMVFVKHSLDSKPYPCPVCGCLKVNGNAYSGVGIKSWECKNRKCFKRSPADRGKRFSARSVMMDSLKSEQNKIDKEFVTRWRRDIVSLSPVIKINCNGKNVLGHTAPFPFEIPEFAIKMLSGVGERVYDPFAGSFTTAIQAYKMGRVGIGSELHRAKFEESVLLNIKKHCGSRKVKVLR